MGCHHIDFSDRQQWIDAAVIDRQSRIGDPAGGGCTAVQIFTSVCVFRNGPPVIIFSQFSMPCFFYLRVIQAGCVIADRQHNLIRQLFLFKKLHRQ